MHESNLRLSRITLFRTTILLRRVFSERNNLLILGFHCWRVKDDLSRDEYFRNLNEHRAINRIISLETVHSITRY